MLIWILQDCVWLPVAQYAKQKAINHWALGLLLGSLHAKATIKLQGILKRYAVKMPSNANRNIGGLIHYLFLKKGGTGLICTKCRLSCEMNFRSPASTHPVIGSCVCKCWMWLGVDVGFANSSLWAKITQPYLSLPYLSHTTYTPHTDSHTRISHGSLRSLQGCILCRVSLCYKSLFRRTNLQQSFAFKI